MRRSYTTYSIGVGIAWLVVLVIASLVASAHKRTDVYLVFGGFAIGWTSATIARVVYPPPRRYLREPTDAG